jgi:flagellar basal-body rod protein FlgG
MAITALGSAASGLRALSTSIDVISNNLSNAETTAFKGARVNFEDLMYQTYREPGTIGVSGDLSPNGISVGLGTKVSGTELNMAQGSLSNTNNPLDLAIQGNGFFKVKVLSTLGNGFAYTRAGNFNVNSTGQLVLGLGDGYLMDPAITIPKGVTEVTIGLDGNVSVLKAGSNSQSSVGQIKLTQFVNPQGLKLLGGSLFQETAASGAAIDSLPGANGAGTIQQNYLEASNVDPVTEMVNLIKVQRSFELNSQSIQSADQALQTISNLRRG